MIAVNAEPIANRTPLKPIDLAPIRHHDEDAEIEPALSIAQAIDKVVKNTAVRVEAARIWKLVVQTSETGGVITPTPSPDVPVIDSVYVAPEAVPAVIYDGIYSEWSDTAPSEYSAPAEDVG